ncbi:MAG: amino acid adenylation domain-containing protein [Nitrospirota bacterium]
MTAGMQELLAATAARFGSNTAVVEPGRGSVTYEELDRLASGLRDWLASVGVQPGDRVGFFLPKSVDSIATICGILKVGAAYVPVDPLAPPSRNAYIFNDCAVAAVIVHESFVEGLRSELAALGSAPPMLLVAAGVAGGGLRAALTAAGGVPPAATHAARPEDLAYILYTSGSTGKPKGVLLTHENGLSFLQWCSETFAPTPDDRMSSHAPLHFDLSILDVHLAIKHGATLVLVDEKTGKDAARLAPWIAEQRISIWYSAPSILAMLVQYGKMDQFDYSALKQILFAGEVFPIKHLMALKKQLPGRRYCNLYGPTETNVCTWYEVPSEVDETRTKPYPIGRCCSHLQCMVIDSEGEVVTGAVEGELVVRGPGVTSGYWNLPEQNARAFHVDADGKKWYRTGDIVVENTDGDYEYLGRRDRMIKKRGYRIELGEIETCLCQHAEVREAAAVAVDDPELGVRVKAFIGTGDAKAPSMVALKLFCSERLPPYMIPDLFGFQPALPRTSTDKIDYQRLKGS